MKKFVSYEKMSKKQQKELNKKSRNTWGNVNPVSRMYSSKKEYKREKVNKNDFEEEV